MKYYEVVLGVLLLLYINFFLCDFALGKDNTNEYNNKKLEKIKAFKTRRIEHFDLLFDKFLSPYAASSYLISLRKSVNILENMLPYYFEKNIFGRYSISIFDNLFNNLLILFSHEIHGHGFRKRIQKNKNLSYNFFTPFNLGSLFSISLFPVGGLGGLTKYNSKKDTLDNVLLNTIAGIEANYILGNQILLENFSNRTMHHNTYNLFLRAISDLFGYTLISKKDEKIKITNNLNTKGDIVEWIELINNKYNKLNNLKKSIILEDVKKASFICAINPIAYFGIYAWYSYIISGKVNFLIPHIRLGSVKYLPIFRFGLSPFGLVYHIDNFININKTSLLLNINYGRSPFYNKSYIGLSLRTLNLYEFSIFIFDILSAIWFQPELDLSLEEKIPDNEFKIGFLMGTKIKIKVYKYCSINLQAFYKSKGFIEGEIAQKGYFFRGGVTIHYL